MGNTPTNALPSDSQPVPATKRRKSMKPAVVQAAIIARSAIGDSKSQIAKDLNVSRGTVYSVLSGNEIEQEQLIGRSRCVRLIPTSVDVIEKRLEKGSETAALAILRGTNVLMNQPIAATTNNYQANTWITMQAQKAAERNIDSITLNASNEPSDNLPSKSEL